MADGSGQAANFADKNDDGTCDNFIDADGDGECETCEAQGGQAMGRRNGGNQSGETAGMAGRRGGRDGNGSQGAVNVPVAVAATASALMKY